MSEIFSEEELKEFPENTQKILREFSKLIDWSLDADRHIDENFFVTCPLDKFANKEYTPEKSIKELLEIRDKKRSK